MESWFSSFLPNLQPPARLSISSFSSDYCSVISHQIPLPPHSSHPGEGVLEAEEDDGVGLQRGLLLNEDEVGFRNVFTNRSGLCCFFFCLQEEFGTMM